MMILLAIAIVIFTITFINFTNFSIALTPMRVKSINTQKILGAVRNTLRMVIASEAPAISLLSFLIAILFLLLFNVTLPAQLVDADMSLSIVCFVIAAPVAWYTVTRWLDIFAYKTPMYWWVYLISFVAVGIIICTTVTFQNWRLANENPVNAIKCE